MMIIRRVFCMLAILALCFGPAAVSGEGALPELDETRTVEISFWAKNDSNKAQAAVYAQAVEEFEKLYPNIKVDLRQYSGYDRICQDVVINLYTQASLPNLCITRPDDIAAFVSGVDAVLELDDWIRDERFGLGGSEVWFDAPSEAEMVPEFLNECLLDGHYYAVPFMRSTEALYINQDIVEALGYELPDVLTWDFVWEVSGKAAEKNADGTFRANGQNVMIPFIWKSTGNMMITMLKQLGAPYAAEDGDALLFNDTTVSLLREIYAHAKAGAFSTFAVSGYPGSLLNAGQCVFAAESTAGAAWMGSEAPLQDISQDRIVPFRIAVRPVPQYDPENPRMISEGPSICIFRKEDPQEMLASWLFAQYLLSNDVQLAYAETEGYLPVTVKALQSKKYQGYLRRKGEDSNEYYAVKIEAAELLADHIQDTFTAPAFRGSSALRDAAGQLIEEVCKYARRGREVDDQTIGGIWQKISTMYAIGGD